MLFLTLVVYIAVSYIYPGELFPAIAPYRITYVTGMVGLTLTAVWLVVKRRSALASWQLWFLAAFTAVMGLSRIVNEHYLGAVVPTVTAFAPSIAMFVMTVSAVDSLSKLRAVAIAVVGLSLVLVAQGAAAYHFGYRSDWFLLDPVHVRFAAPAAGTTLWEHAEAVGEGVQPDADEDATEDAGTQVRIRGSGVLHDPNDLAQALVMALPLLAVASRRRSTWSRLLMLAAAGALVYGVFLTHSRGATVALILTGGIAMWRTLGKTAAVIMLCVLASGALALDFAGGRRMIAADESASGRIEAWREGLQMLKEQPLVGVGYRQFLDHNDLTAHNAFVLCFAETGLAGYFFWLALLAITFVQLNRLRQLPPDDPVNAELTRWAGTLQLSMIGFLSAALFLSRTFIPILYLILGLAVAVLLIARDAERPVWQPSLRHFGGVVPLEIASVVLIYVIVRLRIV